MKKIYALLPVSIETLKNLKHMMFKKHKKH